MAPLGIRYAAHTRNLGLWTRPRYLVLAIGQISLLLLTILGARAQDIESDSGAAAEKRQPGVSEPVGTWKFQTDKPVKVVVVGGSVAAYFGGNFSEQLAAVCPNVEVRNLALARYGAWAMLKRFEAQVLDNRKLQRPPGSESWVIVHGGLNSVAMPEQTNEHIRQLFVAAHGAGFKVLGLSLTPWGAESDTKRWQGAQALFYKRSTQKAVDFVMGRLSPEVALGSSAPKRPAGPWLAQERADIAVDLYDSELRDRDAAASNRAKMEKSMAKSAFARKLLAGFPEEARAGELAKLVDEAVEVPKWFLRKELHAFDHVHPNAEGHRLMAAATCPKLPASWGCDCAKLATTAAPSKP